jgi:hypothetical protein
VSADKDGPVDQAGRGKKEAGPVPLNRRQVAGTGTYSGDGKRGRIPKKEMMMRIAENYGRRDGMRGTVSYHSKGRRRDGDRGAPEG